MTLATRPQWLRHGRRPAHVRLLAALTVVAALRGVLSFAAPASPNAPTTVFLGIAISATALGLAVWFSSCAWCERITPIIGLACVGLVIAVAATGTGAAGASIGYVWLNLYVAFFWSRRATRSYALVSVGSLALALVINPFPGAVAIGVPLGLTVLLVSEATNRLVHALRLAATTDQLTGMLNRNGLFTSAPHALAQAHRTGRPLTVALIDLDGFKQINDAHGHAAGDAMLASLADVWLPLLRGSDVVARFGGDEFVLVLPETDLADATGLMTRLHACSPIAWSHGLALAVPNQSVGDLLAAADADLYRAKTTRSELPIPRPPTRESSDASYALRTSR